MDFTPETWISPFLVRYSIATSDVYITLLLVPDQPGSSVVECVDWTGLPVSA